MNSDELVLVFDLIENGYYNWKPILLGLMFFGIGLCLQFVVRTKTIGPIITKHSPTLPAIAKFFVWGAGILTVVWFALGYARYNKVVTFYQDGQYETVEGIVENFIPLPRENGAVESFTVKGKKFHYSDYRIEPGFRNSRPHGGPMNAGIYVRIRHSGNMILRLEVEPAAVNNTVQDTGVDRRKQQFLQNDQTEEFLTIAKLMIIYSLQAIGFVWFAVRWKLRAKVHISKNPALAAGYSKFITWLIVAGTAPSLLGISTYLSINGFTISGKVGIDFGFFAVLSVLASVCGFFWVYFRGGARKIVEHPGFLETTWGVKLATFVALAWTVNVLWSAVVR
ncbi:MAG: hypothetical protein JKY60_13035 [Kordiimonadaceae bacterium]|nr:hypothetical protein [Kordiimonadaceae bacterium]